MSKIAYECKGCGQKYRIKEKAEEVSCQVCEGQLRQIKMYSVSDYEALPEAGIKQAAEGDILEALEIEGEVLPEVEGDVIPKEAEDPETMAAEEILDNPEGEPESLEVPIEEVEEIQSETTEGEE